MYVCVCTNFSNFILQNYIFFPLNNIINSFRSNTILINYFTTFLQTVLVANSY